MPRLDDGALDVAEEEEEDAGGDVDEGEEDEGEEDEGEEDDEPVA